MVSFFDVGVCVGATWGMDDLCDLRGISIENFAYARIWVAFLGMFLTMATYSAIGLFMSSLTRYPVVAAIGSFVVFIVLERNRGVTGKIGMVSGRLQLVCLFPGG